MARNMCFDHSVSELKQTLMSEEGIDSNDILTAVIGLAGIIETIETNYKIMAARIDKLEKAMDKVDDICGILLTKIGEINE